MKGDIYSAPPCSILDPVDSAISGYSPISRLPFSWEEIPLCHQKLCLRFSQPSLGLYCGIALPQDAALCPFRSACPHVPGEQRSHRDAHGVLAFSVHTQQKRTASRPGGCRVRRGGPGYRLTGSVIAYMLSLIPSALFQVSVRGQAHFSSFFSHPAIRGQKGNPILCLCCSAYLFILVISLLLHYSYSMPRHINL